MTGRSGIWMTVLGIFFGAIFLNFMDKLTPHLHNLSGIDVEKHAHNESLDKVLLFVFALQFTISRKGWRQRRIWKRRYRQCVDGCHRYCIAKHTRGHGDISPMILVGISKRRAL